MAEPTEPTQPSGLVEPSEPGAHYRAVRLRIADLVRAAGPSGWATPVAACPAWTVHDLLAHLAGLTDDALNDNMAGAPGEAWTAAQVARRAAVPTLDGLHEWEANAPRFEALPLPFPPVADIVTHEQDLRTALGRPGQRESAAIGYILPRTAEFAAGHLAERHGLAVRVTAGAHESTAGTGPSSIMLTITPYELVRAVFGRRSTAQLRALPWSGPVEPEVDAMCVFGPRDADLLE